MFIDELKSYIDTNTTLTFGSTLFIGQMPEGVNNCVVLQQGNSDNIYQQGNTLGYMIINIPIRVRGDQTENTTRALASIVETLLENLTVDLTNYRIIRGAFETPIYQLDGTDQNNNYIYAGIYSCIVERK
jgi:hypothetical protein